MARKRKPTKKRAPKHNKATAAIIRNLDSDFPTERPDGSIDTRAELHSDAIHYWAAHKPDRNKALTEFARRLKEAAPYVHDWKRHDLKSVHWRTVADFLFDNLHDYPTGAGGYTTENPNPYTKARIVKETASRLGISTDTPQRMGELGAAAFKEVKKLFPKTSERADYYDAEYAWRAFTNGLRGPLPTGAGGVAQVHPASLPVGAMGSPVQDIPVGAIEADPTQPRKDFNPELLKELADSMATVGQIHPVLVRPHPDKPGAFMLVAGERRFRAAQKAGFKTLRAEVRELSPAQVADIQLAENEARAKPKESETAKFVADRIRKGDSLEKIAKALGKSDSWVRGRQSMAGLAPFLLDLLDGGKLAVGVAAALGELPQEVQRAVWEAAALHSKTASGQEAYVRAVALREAGQDLFGQKIIEHVSGLTPKQRKALITGVERGLRCANKLAANKGGDVVKYAATTTNAAATLEQVKELARALQRAARNVEKVSASRAVSRRQRRPDVMHKTQQHARKPGFWARIFGG